MEIMDMDKLTFDPAQIWPMATKAVANYVGKHFASFFTSQDIEDIVSVVATRMWEHRNSYNPAKGTLFSLIWVISHNAVLDAVAEKDRRRGISGDIERGSGQVLTLPAPGHVDDDLVEEDVLNGFLAKLKSERDERILFYLLEGLDNREIAKREGISESAAAMAVFHLRQRLRNHKGSA